MADDGRRKGGFRMILVPWIDYILPLLCTVIAAFLGHQGKRRVATPLAGLGLLLALSVGILVEVVWLEPEPFDGAGWRGPLAFGLALTVPSVLAFGAALIAGLIWWQKGSGLRRV